jgi:amidase
MNRQDSAPGAPGLPASAPAGLSALPAREAVRLLRRREISPLELIDAALARIEATDDRLNALPTRCVERARDQARWLMAAADRAGRDAQAPGWLAGLPIAVKDLNEVSGVRNTFGSPIFADHVPTRSDIMVETLERNGAIPLAKSNTPEFGAGGNTFNEVFGATLNPWNTALTCGGSSGGSAAALAAGQVWLATGNDFGGSLRIPASFCGVVGLRPSPGRVASGPRERPFAMLSVDGPMARTVCDAALMLDAMTGAHPEDPLSLERPARSFQAAAEERRLPRRVAFSPDLGGIVPVDRRVRAVCAAAAARLASAGVAVEEASPDFAGAIHAFRVLRGASFVGGLGPLYERKRAQLKPDIVWNIEFGLGLTPAQIGAAERARGALYHRVVAFFRDYDLLLCPAAPVPPFPVEQRWVREIDGVALSDYTAWLYGTGAITLTACPTLSLPCGFTEDGLPIGLQIVGPPRGEAALLSAAAAFETIIAPAEQPPIDPRAARRDHHNHETSS